MKIKIIEIQFKLLEIMKRIQFTKILQLIRATESTECQFIGMGIA